MVGEINIRCSEFNGAIPGFFKRRVTVSIDSGVQDNATVRVTVGRHIRSSPRKAKPQGRARTDAADRSLAVALANSVASL
jgi:hypothetical protein